MKALTKQSKIRYVGNSFGITIPKTIADFMQLEKGAVINIILDIEKEKIIIEKSDTK